MNVAEVLDRAADRLMIDGWVQRDLHNVGGHCALGALEMVTIHELAYFPEALTIRDNAIDALLEHLNHTDAWHLAAWNDEPGRTADEVIDMMRHCAKALRETEQVEL